MMWIVVVDAGSRRRPAGRWLRHDRWTDCPVEVGSLTDDAQHELVLEVVAAVVKVVVAVRISQYSTVQHLPILSHGDRGNFPVKNSQRCAQVRRCGLLYLKVSLTKVLYFTVL